MGKLRKIRSIIFILIPVILLASYNNTAYKHTHILSDGQVITHAHPFSKDNQATGTKHKHNKVEFMILSLLYNLASLLCILFLALLIFGSVEQKKPIPKAVLIKHYHFSNTPHRGPPTDY